MYCGWSTRCRCRCRTLDRVSDTDAIVLPRNPWWLRHPALLRDAAIGVAVLAAGIEIVRAGVLAGGPLPMIGSIAGAAGAVIARRFAWLGLSVTIFGCAISAGQGWEPIVGWTIVVFTLFATTVRGARPVRGVLVSAIPLYLIIAIESDAGFVGPDVLAAVAAVIAAAAVGAGIRSQQQYWTALRQRADDAIASRDREARRRVQAERVRIARDLHDLVGHQVAVASMHLGVVEVTVHRDADTAAEAAAAARTAMRTVTAETQHILDLLRSGPGESPGLEVAGMGSLPGLLSSFDDSRFHVDGLVDVPDEVQVPPLVGMTAYRVVQEALTNAHRYGDGTVRVRVSASDDTLTVDVNNPVVGRAQTSSGSGYGLLGMRERVAETNGTVEISEDETMFTVHVRLPITGRSTR